MNVCKDGLWLETYKNDEIKIIVIYMIHF